MVHSGGGPGLLHGQRAALRKPRSNHPSPMAATPDQRSASALHETPTIIFLAMNGSSLSGKRSGGDPRRVIIIKPKGSLEQITARKLAVLLFFPVPVGKYTCSGEGQVWDVVGVGGDLHSQN